MHRTIDLNCDIGEGGPFDLQLIELITSANISCGAHAGNMQTMQIALEAAQIAGISVGAHPGIPDRSGYGRTLKKISPQDAYDIVYDQVSQFCLHASKQEVQVMHVKPHGALYNISAKDPDVAYAIAHAVKDVDPGLVLFGLAGSVSTFEAREMGLRTAEEVFADRSYQPDGTLTPRGNFNATIENGEQAAAQTLEAMEKKFFIDVDGVKVPVKIETICIHGDNPNVLEVAWSVRSMLNRSGYSLTPFAFTLPKKA
jgi:UPF0271 protein